jgi:hypothetical protein
MLALGGCSDMNAAGIYDGTLSVSLPAGTVMTASVGSLDASAFDLHSASTTPASCLLQQRSQQGSSIGFDCVRAQCFCDINSTSLIVTAASGTVTGAVLTIQFSGTVGSGDAFTGSFMGTHE